ncbi:MAG: HAD-IB family hydrolase [Proteobacteria bacterium]|nr:HAD-IB family hydrolase [Pseudomonadota bacterium]
MPGLAVFDLDGTITRHDTLAPYVFGFLARHPRGWLGLPRVLPCLLQFAVGAADQGMLKSAFIRSTLGGRRRAQITEWTRQFVQALPARGIFPDALARIDFHRGRGDTLVLLSASTDLYVPELAGLLGFDHSICTGVAWDHDRLVGTLTTPNRRGAEKVRCLEQLRREFPGRPVSAYGNAPEDVAHLQMADRPLLVNGNRRARRLAAARGIPSTTWQ